MAMEDWKSVFSRIFWKNKRAGGTPLNEANLNTGDIAMQEFDNRILELRDAKFGKAEANALIKDWKIDEKTGIITVTWLNDTTKVYDLNIEKIPVNFEMSDDGIITMTTDDGTKFKTDIKKAIPIYTFKGSATIKVTPSIGKSGDKAYTFEIVDGSIDGTKLDPDYLAQINTSVGNASNYAESAQTSATAAATSELNAKTSETNAQAYAIGAINSAKYYYEQSKTISESFSGALRPMGTVAFASLPTLASASEGDMYNISNQFMTTAEFKEGSGFIIPAGANVYKTSDGKWDILAGTPVTGVKGNKESTYRRGNVNITPVNIGALAEDGNTNNNTVSFTSADSTSPTAWTDVAVLASGEKHSSLFNKISTMFKNIRWLYKMLGTTDISKIGNGTVTGALDTLNSNFDKKISNPYYDNSGIKQGIAFDDNADGSYFTFRPILSGNILQVTKNDAEALLNIESNGNVVTYKNFKVTNNTNSVELFADNEGGSINLNNIPNNRAIQQDVLNGAYRAYLYQIDPWQYLNDITIHPDKITTQKDFVNGNGIALNNCLTQYSSYISSGFYSYDSNHIAYDFTAPLKGMYLFIVNFRPIGCASSCRLKIGNTGSDPIGGVTNVPEYAFDSFPAAEHFNASETKKLLFEMTKCEYTIRMTVIKVSN